MNVHYFKNPFQTLQNQESVSPDLQQCLIIPLLPKIYPAYKSSIIQSSYFTIAFSRQKAIIYNKQTFLLKELRFQSSIITNISVCQDFYGINLDTKDKGKLFIIFNYNSTQIRSFPCIKGQLSQIGKFNQLYNIEIVLQLQLQIQVIDLTIQGTKISTTIRYLCQKQTFRIFQVMNGMVLSDELLYRIQAHNLQIILQDPRNFLITSYQSKFGPQLSWKIFNYVNDIILLGNEVISEIHYKSLRANFLHLLSSPIEFIVSLKQDQNIIVFVSSKFYIHYCIFNEQLELQERINRVNLKIFPGEQIKSVQVINNQLNVFTNLQRQTFYSQEIDMVTQPFRFKDRRIKINKKSQKKINFSFKEFQQKLEQQDTGNLDFLLG